MFNLGNVGITSIYGILQILNHLPILRLSFLLGYSPLTNGCLLYASIRPR